MARKKKLSAAAKRIVARLNGLKSRTNRKRRGARKNTRRAAFGGLALRTNRKRRSARRNGLALRTNGIRRNRVRHNVRRNKGHSRRRVSRRNSIRRNGLALRTNPKRTRRNGRFGKHLRMNGKHLRMNPKHRRRARRNPEGSSLPFVGSVRSMVGKVPFIGKPLSGIIGPAALGAVSFGASALLLKYVVGPHILPRLPAQVSQYLAPVGYTAMGAVTGALIKFVPGKLLSPGAKNAIAGAAVLAGAVADVYRYMQGTSSTFGDGGYWQLGDGGYGAAYMPLSGAMGDADYGATTSAYQHSANAGDAMYCGPDLDAGELGAAAAGPRAWAQRFPMPRLMTKMQDGPSPMAQRPGHRWGWLIRMIGMESFQQLAQLPPQERQAYIAQLKAHALSSLPASIQAQQANMAGLVYAGGSYAAA